VGEAFSTELYKKKRLKLYPYRGTNFGYARWAKSSLEPGSLSGAQPLMKSLTCKFSKVVEK